MRTKLTIGTALIAGAAVLLAQSPVWAHHAFAAEFDANKPVKFLDATVTKVQLINPHSWIHVDVKGADGKIENWGYRSGKSEHSDAARYYERHRESRAKDQGRGVSVEGRFAQGQRQGPHAAGWYSALPGRLGYRRSLRSAASWRRYGEIICSGVPLHF